MDNAIAKAPSNQGFLLDPFKVSCQAQPQSGAANIHQAPLGSFSKWLLTPFKVGITCGSPFQVAIYIRETKSQHVGHPDFEKPPKWPFCPPPPRPALHPEMFQEPTQVGAIVPVRNEEVVGLPPLRKDPSHAIGFLLVSKI